MSRRDAIVRLTESRIGSLTSGAEDGVCRGPPFKTIPLKPPGGRPASNDHELKQLAALPNHDQQSRRPANRSASATIRA